MTVQVVIFRDSSNERTCAVLTCDNNPLLLTPADLKDAVRAAVSDWAKTKYGQQILKETKGEFNVVDLAINLDQIQPHLILQGVDGFDINIFSDNNPIGWSFDDNLYCQDKEADTSSD